MCNHFSKIRGKNVKKKYCRNPTYNINQLGGNLEKKIIERRRK
jgi:hypothetical protein